MNDDDDVHLDNVSVIQSLISHVRQMIKGNFEPLKVIKDPLLLIEALKDLDSLVEMDDIKTTIVSQIQMMIILAYKRYKNGSTGARFDNHMLHSAIYGPPGVGKSSSARKIAKVFYAIGVIDQIRDSISASKSKPNTTFEPFVYKGRSPNTLPPSPPVNNINSESAEPITHEAGEMLSEINKFRVCVNSLKRKIKYDEEIFEEEADLLIQKSSDIALKCTNIISLCQNVKVEEESEPIPFGAATITMNPPILPTPKIRNSGCMSMEAPKFQLPPNTNKCKDKPKPTKVKDPFQDVVVVCGRSELVAEYSGQSTIKTKEFLMANRGKVVIIEEAYLLYTGERDQFGMEALTELNRFMDEHASEIIIYMTGYRELMLNTIFKAQPGLKRRCCKVFNIEGYTPNGLMEIFKQQINSKDWSLAPDIKLKEFFDTHHATFTNFGGDTYNLSYHCKQMYSNATFKDIFKSFLSEGEENTTPTLVITSEILEDALKSFKSSRVKDKDALKETTPPEGMYV